MRPTTDKTFVYMAGAFTGKTVAQTEFNINKAQWYLKSAMTRTIDDIVFVLPHNMFLGNGDTLEAEDNVKSGKYYYEATLQMMKRCDAVLVFDSQDLHSSKGTANEVAIAQELKIPVHYSIPGVWLKNN